MRLGRLGRAFKKQRNRSFGAALTRHDVANPEVNCIINKFEKG